MSASYAKKMLKLTQTNILVDGRILKKVKLFDLEGLRREYFKCGGEEVESIQRLNFPNASENWLSLQPKGKGII